MDTEKKELAIYRSGTLATVSAFCHILSELLETDVNGRLDNKHNPWMGDATAQYASLQYQILIKFPIGAEMTEIDDRIWAIQDSLHHGRESKEIKSLFGGLYRELERVIK